jgi:hypothetical protein
MKKAFFDLIDKNVNSKKPDFDWIARLYQDIKFKLLSFLPNKKGKVYQQIDNDFDVELFKQMIENDVFNQESMVKLINNTFFWISELEAPIRDEETLEAKKRVLTSEPTKIISTYLKEVHTCIEQIELDIIASKKKE